MKWKPRPSGLTPVRIAVPDEVHPGGEADVAGGTIDIDLPHAGLSPLHCFIAVAGGRSGERGDQQSAEQAESSEHDLPQPHSSAGIWKTGLRAGRYAICHDCQIRGFRNPNQ
jgi:hypothetical protein